MKKMYFLPTLLVGLQSIFATTAYAGIVVEGNGNDLVLKPGNFPSLNGNLQDTVHEANQALGRATTVGNFIFAIIMLVLLALLIANITKLAAAGSDEKARKEAITRLLYTLIAIALMGSIGLIAALSTTIL